MCRQTRKKGYRKPQSHCKSHTRYEGLEGKFPGDRVQIDIKYVPQECIRFPSYGLRYYQITAVDEFSRKHVLKIVDEKSIYEITKFLDDLEEKMGFSINTIQVDNGSEFVNDDGRANRESRFELAVRENGWLLRSTRPYSPWKMGEWNEAIEKMGKFCIIDNFLQEKKFN